MPTAPKQHRPANHGQAKREYEQRRHSASERGYGTRWSKYKPLALAQMVVDEANPYCRYCDRNEATTLDHGIPPTRVFAVGTAEYERLFWLTELHIPSCSRCNAIKQDLLPNELPEWMKLKLWLVLESRGLVNREQNAFDIVQIQGLAIAQRLLTHRG